MLDLTHIEKLMAEADWCDCNNEHQGDCPPPIVHIPLPDVQAILRELRASRALVEAVEKMDGSTFAGFGGGSVQMGELNNGWRTVRDTSLTEYKKNLEG